VPMPQKGSAPKCTRIKLAFLSNQVKNSPYEPVEPKKYCIWKAGKKGLYRGGVEVGKLGKRPWD
jgi:hypothetical protein